MKLYSFGGDNAVITSTKVIIATVGRCYMDDVEVEAIPVYVVPNPAQHPNAIVGRSFTKNERVCTSRRRTHV